MGGLNTSSLQVFVISAETKRDIARVIEYASRPENLYIPGPSAKIPGDDPGHIHCQNGIRAVFSLTQHRKTRETYRHLSLSVEGAGSLPNPAIAEEILSLFGFSGGVRNCTIAVNTAEECVIFVQSLPS